MTQRRGLGWMAACLGLALAACSPSNNADAGRPAECEAIVDRCHDLDRGTGPIHECHEFAENPSNTAATCMARQAECFAACVATDAGADAPAAD